MTWPNSRPGVRSSESRSFCEPLWLPGWSDRSVWGYEEPTGSYYAQLWPDGDDADSPAIWISGVSPISDLQQLADLVVSATAKSRVQVLALLVSDHQQVPRRSQVMD